MYALFFVSFGPGPFDYLSPLQLKPFRITRFKQFVQPTITKRADPVLSETYYGQINIRFSPLQENAEKPIYFWVHQGPKGLHKRCIIISSSFVSAKINARYCCCSRVKAWWMITWASFRAWGTDLKRSSGSLSTGKRSLVSSTVKVVPLPDGL